MSLAHASLEERIHDFLSNITANGEKGLQLGELRTYESEFVIQLQKERQQFHLVKQKLGEYQVFIEKLKELHQKDQQKLEEEAQRQVDDLQLQLKEVQNQLVVSEQHRDSLQEELLALSRKLEEQARVLEEKITSLTNELETKTELVTALEAQVVQLNNDKNSLEQAVQQNGDEIADLKEQLSDQKTRLEMIREGNENELSFVQDKAQGGDLSDLLFCRKRNFTTKFTSDYRTTGINGSRIRRTEAIANR